MKIAVLLSIYKPDLEYLNLQIASILRQTVKPCIYARFDDCNPLVDCFYEKSIKVDPDSENLGIEKSFRRLIGIALEDGCDVFMFCDQDDIWKPEKVARSIELMDKENRACLVTTKYELIDSRGEPINDRTQDRLSTKFPSAIFRNTDNGNCMAFNRPLAEIYLKTELSNPQILHDSWMHLLGQLVAIYKVVDYVSVGYRQHQKNAVGIKNKNICRRIVDSIRNKYYAAQYLQLVKNVKNIEMGTEKAEVIGKKSALVFAAYREVSILSVLSFIIGAWRLRN